MAHRQRSLVHRIAERERIARRILEESIASRIAQFVLNLGGRKIRHGIAKLAALERQHLKSRLGELLGQYGAGPAKSHQDDIHRLERIRHGQPLRSNVPLRPRIPTVGSV